MLTLINHKQVDIRLLWKCQQMKISAQFLECIDEQLTRQYLAITGCKITKAWYGLKIPYEHQPVISYGEISTMVLGLTMPQKRLETVIAWRSKSGRIYRISDEDIDCNDLECYFMAPNEKIIHRWGQMPDKSLLFWEGGGMDFVIAESEKVYGLKCSVYFFECANRPISNYFEKSTGIKVNHNIKITDITQPYEKGEVSNIGLRVYVVDGSSPLKLCWRSKSGAIYTPSDEDFDCCDVEFWLEDLQPAYYMKQINLYKDTPQLPFALKNLNYQLTVNLIQTDCRMEMVLKQGMAQREVELLERIYSFIDRYNDNSENKHRKYGVVHNASGYLDQNNKNLLHLEIDIGSVGPDFFKKLFKLFNDLDAFESVTVD